MWIQTVPEVFDLGIFTFKTKRDDNVLENVEIRGFLGGGGCCKCWKSYENGWNFLSKSPGGMGNSLGVVPLENLPGILLIGYATNKRREVTQHYQKTLHKIRSVPLGEFARLFFKDPGHITFQG